MPYALSYPQVYDKLTLLSGLCLGRESLYFDTRSCRKEVHVRTPCLVEVALLRALVVRPERCVICRQKAAVELAVPAGLLQAEHLHASPHSVHLSRHTIDLSCSRLGAGPWWSEIALPALNLSRK